MDAADELRGALERRDAEEKAEKHRRDELDRRRREYERDEASVRQQLRAAVDLAVQALANPPALPTRVAITPPPASTGLGRFFERRQFAVGWKVLWAGHDRVLCPDGTLITPGRDPTTSTLSAALYSGIDRHLEDVRRGSTAGIEAQVDFFTEAFGNGPAQGRERNIRELHERLSAARESFMRAIADLLRQLDISAI